MATASIPEWLASALVTERFAHCSFTSQPAPAVRGSIDYGDTAADHTRRQKILNAALDGAAPVQTFRRRAAGLAPVVPLRRLRKAS